MRASDELLFSYPNLDEHGRGLALAELEDAPGDDDVFSRSAFLGDQAHKEQGVLAHQALAGFTALLPPRRLAGWARSTARPAAVPVLGSGQGLEGLEPSPMVMLALGFAAEGAYLGELVRSLPRTPDPFPLALALAHRTECRDAVISLVESRGAELPGLLLLPGLLFGKAINRVIQSLAPTVGAHGRGSLLRCLPGHPERSWQKSFRCLVEPWDEEVAQYALLPLGRIATPKATSELRAMAMRLASDRGRIQALRALARSTGTRAVDLAQELIDSERPAVQAAALEVLIERGQDPGARERAAVKLRTADGPKARCLALAVLAPRDPSALAQLESQATADDPSVRLAAAVALGVVADDRSRWFLERLALEDTSRTVATTALRSLSGICATLPVTVFRDLLAAGGTRSLVAAEVLLGRAAIRPGEVFDILGSRPEPGPGLLALGVAVAATGAREGLAVLAEPLKAADSRSLHWAIEALFPLGKAIPRSVLAPHVRSKVATVRARAAVALALTGDARGLQALRGLMRSNVGAPHAARSILDLAAITPNVAGRPLFDQVTTLTSRLRARPLSKDGSAEPLDRESSGEIVPDEPAWRPPQPEDILSVRGMRTDEFDLLASQGLLSRPRPGPPPRSEPVDVPSRPPGPQTGTGGPPDSLRSSAPEPPAAPPPAPAQAKPVEGRPPGIQAIESAPAPASLLVAASAALSGSKRTAGAVLLVALVVGLVLGLSTLDRTSPVALPGSAAPTARASSTRALFTPFSAIGLQLTRAGTTRRGFTVADVATHGDVLGTTSAGGAVLISAGGSRLRLDRSSGVRLKEWTSEQGRRIAIGSLTGRVKVDWRDPESLVVEFPAGSIEMKAGGLAVEEGRTLLTAGEATWTPLGGPRTPLSPGAQVETGGGSPAPAR